MKARVNFQVLVLLSMVTLGVLCTMTHARAAEALSPGERIALARLKEIRTVADPIQRLSWPDFNAADVASVMYEPDGWAVAVGFKSPPPGFTPIDGVMDGDRPVYRAAPGAFSQVIHDGRSPALVAGQWAVLSRFDPPETVPSGLYTGRRSAEEALAAFVGDSFLIHLMQQRKKTTPFSIGTAAYPETPELMALTTMENAALVAPLQFRQVDERNIEEFRKKMKEAVAVHHARLKLIGPELADLEKEIENTEGLGLYSATLVYRHAINQSFKPTAVADADPTFRGYEHAFQNRVMATNYPLSYTVDNPAMTQRLVAQRGGTIGSVLDKIDAPWRPEAPEGKASRFDALAAKQEIKPDDEPAMLEAAKADYRYDLLLGLATDDLARLRRQREAVVARLFPAGASRLVITLSGAPVASYQDDPDTTGHLGEGRLLHPGGVSLQTAGLRVIVSGAIEATGAAGALGVEPALMTQAGARRDAVKTITVRLGLDSGLTIGGKRLKTVKSGTLLSQTLPLELKTPEIALKVTAGMVSTAPDGSVQVDLTGHTQP